jgi:hypothetical protein
VLSLDIAEGLESFAVVRSTRDKILERIRLRKKGESISFSDRVRLWFINNPGIVIQPASINTGMDWHGNDLLGFPRGRYGTFRNICVRLRNEGLITYYRDPKSGRPLKPLYLLNESYLLFEEGTTPEKEYHGVKFDIKDPKHKKTTLRNVKGHVIPPWKLRDKLLSQDIIKFHAEQNAQEHTWTYTGQWNKRKITVNLAHKNTNNIEIWIKATKNPLSVYEFDELGRDLHLVWGDIWIHSDVFLSLIGINRDVDGFQLLSPSIYWPYAKDYFLKIYQKRNSVRFEGHIHGHIDYHALKKGLELSNEDVGSFKSAHHVGRVEKKLDEMERLNKLLEERLGEQSDSIFQQSLQISRVADNFGSLIRLLEAPLDQKKAHSSFQTADNLDENPSYG